MAGSRAEIASKRRLTFEGTCSFAAGVALHSWDIRDGVFIVISTIPRRVFCTFGDATALGDEVDLSSTRRAFNAWLFGMESFLAFEAGNMIVFPGAMLGTLPHRFSVVLFDTTAGVI